MKNSHIAPIYKMDNILIKEKQLALHLGCAFTLTRHSAIIYVAAPCGTQACAVGLPPGGTYLSLSRVTELCTSFILPPGISPKSRETRNRCASEDKRPSLRNHASLLHTCIRGQTRRQEPPGAGGVPARPSGLSQEIRVCRQSLGKGQVSTVRKPLPFGPDQTEPGSTLSRRQMNKSQHSASPTLLAAAQRAIGRAGRTPSAPLPPPNHSHTTPPLNVIRPQPALSHAVALLPVYSQYLPPICNYCILKPKFWAKHCPQCAHEQTPPAGAARRVPRLPAQVGGSVRFPRCRQA